MLHSGGNTAIMQEMALATEVLEHVQSPRMGSRAGSGKRIAAFAADADLHASSTPHKPVSRHIGASSRGHTVAYPRDANGDAHERMCAI